MEALAEAEALMAWGVGQLEAVNHLLEAIASSSGATDAPGLARAVGNLTAQAETVLRTALQVHRNSFME
jgi:hypothetical protein